MSTKADAVDLTSSSVGTKRSITDVDGKPSKKRKQVHTGPMTINIIGARGNVTWRKNQMKNKSNGIIQIVLQANEGLKHLKMKMRKMCGKVDYHTIGAFTILEKIDATDKESKENTFADTSKKVTKKNLHDQMYIKATYTYASGNIANLRRGGGYGRRMFRQFFF